jgi:hypothetical protein
LTVNKHPTTIPAAHAHGHGTHTHTLVRRTDTNHAIVHKNDKLEAETLAMLEQTSTQLVIEKHGKKVATTTPADKEKEETDAKRPVNVKEFILPEGLLGPEEVQSIVTLIETGSTELTYPLLFHKLYGGERKLNAGTLRPFMRPVLMSIQQRAKQRMQTNANSAAGPAFNLLSIMYQKLKEMRTTRTGELFLEFDFGDQQSATLNIPEVDNWVMDSVGYPKDPYLVHPKNVVKLAKNEARTFIVNKSVHFKLKKNGIAYLREGDLQVKQFLKFNANLRTEVKRGIVQVDLSNRPVLEDNEDGTGPLIVDKHYVPRTSDYWLVITVLKQDNWVALPVLPRPMS